MKRTIPILATVLLLFTLSSCSSAPDEDTAPAAAKIETTEGDQEACALIAGSSAPQRVTPEEAATILSEAASLADNDVLVQALQDASEQAIRGNASPANTTISVALTFCKGVGFAKSYDGAALQVRNPAEEQAQSEEAARIAAEEERRAEEEAAAEVERKAAEEAAAKEAQEAADAAAAEAERVAAFTMGQSNAIRKGRDYLSLMAFSRQGLIEQLEYEGFSSEDATFAVDEIAPDWSEQAALKAQDYLDLMSFSRQGLIEQLMYEGFSYEQAEHGVTAVGY